MKEGLERVTARKIGERGSCDGGHSRQRDILNPPGKMSAEAETTMYLHNQSPPPCFYVYIDAMKHAIIVEMAAEDVQNSARRVRGSIPASKSRRRRGRDTTRHGS